MKTAIIAIGAGVVGAFVGSIYTVFKLRNVIIETDEKISEQAAAVIGKDIQINQLMKSIVETEQELSQTKEALDTTNAQLVELKAELEATSAVKKARTTRTTPPSAQ